MEDLATNKEKGSRSAFSEIQKRKMHHFFNTLDIDRNGILQLQDFIHVGQVMIERLGLEAESRSARVIILKAQRLFVQLLTDIENPEMELTLWDWVEFFRSQIESDDSRTLSHYVHHTSRHIFDLFDVNNDDLISRQEYADMLAAYNIPLDQTADGFVDLDTNEDGFISSMELVQGLSNFFSSSEETARGNLIFGEWR